MLEVAGLVSLVTNEYYKVLGDCLGMKWMRRGLKVFVIGIIRCIHLTTGALRGNHCSSLR